MPEGLVTSSKNLHSPLLVVHNILVVYKFLTRKKSPYAYICKKTKQKKTPGTYARAIRKVNINMHAQLC